MMRAKKSAFAFLILFGMFLLTVAPIFAQDKPAGSEPLSGSYSERVGEKLGRGIENLIVGWMEIPYQIRKTSKEKGVLQGSTLGVGKGVAMTLFRMAVGVYEIATFPYPQEPILEPTEKWQW